MESYLRERLVCLLEMIAGDKKALRASIKHGLNNVMRNLVDLYAANLDSLGE